MRCPTWLPEAKWRIRYATIESGSQAYLSDFRTSDPAEGLAFHVLAGGRTGPFSLRVTDGGEWPVKVPAAGRRCCYGGPRALSLIGAREGSEPGTYEPVRQKVKERVEVDSNSALLLTAAGFPEGGIHAGHRGIVWNQGKNGYVLTIHFTPQAHLPADRQDALLLQAAVKMSRSLER